MVDADVAGLILCAAAAERRGYRNSDVVTLTSIAQRAGIAISRVALYREIRTAAVTAERRAAQLRRLAKAATDVSAQLSREGVAHAVAGAARLALGATRAIVEVPADEDGPLHVSVGETENGSAGPTLTVGFHAPVGGTLRVIGGVGTAFDDDDRSILESLANLASVSLSNVSLYQAAQRSEARIGAVVESSPLGIVELDARAVVVDANAAAKRIMGTGDVADLDQDSARDAQRDRRPGVGRPAARRQRRVGAVGRRP